MRIAFAHYNSVEDISGVTTWLVQLAVHLQRHGCQVAVHLFDQCQPGETSPLEKALECQGIVVCTAPPSGTLKGDVQTTLAFLNRWRPDVFLPQCKPHHYVAAAITGRRGLPWVLTLHSDDPDYWATATSLPPSRHGGRCVCVSRHIQRSLARRGGEAEAAVISYGVSIPAEVARFNDNPFHVVYSGRLWEHQKRASLVVQTLIHACQRGEGRIQATLIGDGYSRADCEQRVREAGLLDRIHFMGRVPQGKVQEVLLNSQALLLMSDFEGLPVALLEAMAAGVVPVVRSIPSGIPEVLQHGHTGLLVSDDPEDAADALLSLAGDPVLWQRCSEAARQLVDNHYSIERSQQQWLVLLQAMVGRANPSFPIKGWQGVQLWRLSPLMKAPYRKPARWNLKELRQSMPTRIALFKAFVRSCLKGND